MASTKGDGRVACGRRGEEAARALLERRGYQIVDVNVRFGRKSGLVGELDIVAWDGPTLAFVEVKTRKAMGGLPVSPVESVTPAKQRRIARLALAYAARHGLCEDVPIRFDVVAVVLDQTGEYARMDLLPGAFLADDEIAGEGT
jgi:putative endonuclease